MVCSSVLLYGQTDRIYIKNGGLVKGKIYSEELSDTIEVVIEGSLIQLPLSIIEEIQPHPKNHHDFEPYKQLTFPKGWSTGISGGTVFGKQNENEGTKVRPYFTISQIYRQHPLLNLGFGTGIFAYRDFNVYPVFLEYYALMGKSRNALMLYGAAGKSWANSTQELAENIEVTGGTYFNAGIGWHKRVGTNNLQIKFGYVVQVIEETQELNNNYDLIRTRNINRLALQLNYYFNY